MAIVNKMKEVGINPDVVSNNSLISSVVRKCLLQNSLRDEMLQSGIRPDGNRRNEWCFHDIVKRGEIYLTMTSYIVMINGYVNNALMLYRNLQRRGFVSEVLTYNVIINGLCKVRRLADARSVLEEFCDFGYELNAITYTTVMYSAHFSL
ncbi:PPR repeat protein [Medicago truncatula]|uniref:PPR repeat protein n=1 Tax=Medicago truncatula TaxID=3880 RepID=A0A072TG83_MEDTR|nr:PPR repeat protein [Medicago truncatula]